MFVPNIFQYSRNVINAEYFARPRYHHERFEYIHHGNDISVIFFWGDVGTRAVIENDSHNTSLRKFRMFCKWRAHCEYLCMCFNSFFCMV